LFSVFTNDPLNFILFIYLKTEILLTKDLFVSSEEAIIAENQYSTHLDN
jgi:hypothetical protein